MYPRRSRAAARVLAAEAIAVGDLAARAGFGVRHRSPGGGGRRSRSGPGGPGPAGPLRRSAGRRADRAHHGRPGRDGAAGNDASAVPASTAWPGCARVRCRRTTPGLAARSSAFGAADTDGGAAARPASRRSPTPPMPRSPVPPQPGPGRAAPSHRCDISGRDPVPVLARQAELLGRGRRPPQPNGRRDRPDRRPCR